MVSQTLDRGNSMTKLLTGTLVLVCIFLPNAVLAKSQRVANGFEPTGALRQKQFQAATKICQKKYGSQYGAYGSVRAEWGHHYGQHGWFCVNR